MKKNHAVRIIRLIARDARYRLGSILLIFILGLTLTFSLRTVSKAGVQHETEVSYESIRVNSGDTLWDIAGEYMCPEFKNQKALVAEISRINHIADEDSIHSGCYLVVPVYR